MEYAEVDDPQYFSPEHKGWYSYIKDQVGTITKVYKHETKQMIDTRTYDTFGNLISQTGSSNGNLGYQSKYFDQESGLNYYYHRYYYPKIGRFINEDPIGLKSGINLFQFNRNNPINFIDLFGEQMTPPSVIGYIKEIVGSSLSESEKTVIKVLEGDKCARCMLECMVSRTIEKIIIDAIIGIIIKNPPKDLLYKVLKGTLISTYVIEIWEDCKIDCRDVCCVY